MTIPRPVPIVNTDVLRFLTEDVEIELDGVLDAILRGLCRSRSATLVP